ncbi:hypothetical protein DSECCO2_133410 [anaerobic digester metagenome]
MKKMVKGFLISAVAAMLLFTTAYASNLQKIEVMLNGVNISMNGKQIVKAGEEGYTLNNGTKVPYSINYGGTTYLPMGAVTELANKNVGYVKGTVNIADKPGTDLLPPITASSKLTYDAEGKPNLDCKIYNIGNKDIKSYKMIMYCYDKNLVPVIEKNKKNNIVILGETDTSFKANSVVEKYISLEGLEGTQVYQVVVFSVTFTDGTVWKI